MCFGKHQTNLLVPLVAAVLAATLVQGVTSYALTQLLSKAAQRDDHRTAAQGAGTRGTAPGGLLRLPTRPAR